MDDFNAWFKDQGKKEVAAGDKVLKVTISGAANSISVPGGTCKEHGTDIELHYDENGRWGFKGLPIATIQVPTTTFLEHMAKVGSSINKIIAWDAMRMEEQLERASRTAVNDMRVATLGIGAAPRGMTGPAIEDQSRPSTEKLTAPISEELLEFNGCLDGSNKEFIDEVGWSYPCRICKRDCGIGCMPEEFDPDMHYCGRSPRCCP